MAVIQEHNDWMWPRIPYEHYNEHQHRYLEAKRRCE